MYQTKMTPTSAGWNRNCHSPYKQFWHMLLCSGTTFSCLLVMRQLFTSESSSSSSSTDIFTRMDFHMTCPFLSILSQTLLLHPCCILFYTSPQLDFLILSLVYLPPSLSLVSHMAYSSCPYFCPIYQTTYLPHSLHGAEFFLRKQQSLS